MSLDLTTTKNDASHLIYEKPTLDVKKLDSIDMMKDVLSGDTDLLAKWEANLDAMGGIETLQTALKWLQEADPYGDYKQLIANEGWRLTYRRRPPTPEEFLTYEWIGPQSEALWPNIKKCFIEFLDPNPLSPARNMALSTSIGWGKSLLTNLILSYIIVLFGLMRKPYQLLGHSPMTAYSVGMCSATLNKAWDLLGVPFEQLIEQSPFFEKVGRHDDIVRVNEEDKECSKCYYTTAARGSAKMVFRNNLQLKLVSTEGALLGNAQPMYSKIMKSDGTYYEMRDVQLGDKIKSPTEGETEVIGIFPQGERDIFEIELDDGRKVRSSDNHLWKVAISKNEKGEWDWQVVNTLQLIDWLNEGKEIEIYDESNAPEVRL